MHASQFTRDRFVIELHVQIAGFRRARVEVERLFFLSTSLFPAVALRSLDLFLLAARGCHS